MLSRFTKSCQGLNPMFGRRQLSLTFDAIISAMPSKNVNMWKMSIAGNDFLVTPAHVAIFEKEGVWKFSPFLHEYEKLTWKVPADFVEKQGVEWDLA